MQIIHLGEFPERPDQEEADRAMAIVGETLGGEWTVEKRGDAWLVLRDGLPTLGGPRLRFEVALGQATGCAIVCTQPR